MLHALGSKFARLPVALRMRRRLWDGVRTTLDHECWIRSLGVPMLPETPGFRLIEGVREVSLIQPRCGNGNVSLTELGFLAALVNRHAPEQCFEIGTFDGNTTLQIAANTPPSARVVTLDLPLEEAEAPEGVAPGDVQFVASPQRRDRAYAHTAYAAKVTEVFGDSLTYPIASQFPDGIDFCFVDGSHSYAYVKSDTERVLPLLRPGGVVVWHDYCRAWPGVVRYLGELSSKLPLSRIEGTTLVVYRSDGA